MSTEIKWRDDAPADDVPAAVHPTREDAKAALAHKSAWELENELVLAIQMLEDVPEGMEPPEFVQELVFGAMKDADAKRDALAGAYLRRMAHVDALEARAKDARDKAASAERGAARLRDYILSVMDLTDTQKLEGEQYTIRWQRNPESVEVAEGFADRLWLRVVPETVTPDKPAIKKALKAGVTIEGARLVEGARRVVIK